MSEAETCMEQVNADRTIKIQGVTKAHIVCHDVAYASCLSFNVIYEYNYKKPKQWIIYMCT